MITLLIFLCIWLGCGVLTSGITYAYFQGEYFTLARSDERDDRHFAIVFGLCFGIVGLGFSFVASNFMEHGFRLPFGD